MQAEPFLPDDPRARFLDLSREIASHKRWFENWSMLRYAALGLITAQGSPAELARDLAAAADQLKSKASWFSALRTDVRFCLVAGLVRRGHTTEHFLQVLGTTRDYFREAHLPRGETEEALACQILMDASPDGRPSLEQVRAMAEVHGAMKSHHRFLTGRDDYPVSALLAGTGDALPEIVRRLEFLYDGLRELSFKRGNQLQLASHLLYFAPWPDDILLRRFRALYSAFESEGLSMNEGDYDEVACLAFLDHDPRRVVSRVLEDRRVLREQMSPRPSKQEGFTLACSTTFLDLATHDAQHQRLTDAMGMAQVITLLQAQQAAAAAMMAAVASSSAASAG
jgi:Protein of unknown function (DUF4003)